DMRTDKRVGAGGPGWASGRMYERGAARVRSEGQPLGVTGLVDEERPPRAVGVQDQLAFEQQQLAPAEHDPVAVADVAGHPGLDQRPIPTALLSGLPGPR